MAGAKNITAKGASKYYYERDPILNADGQQQNTSWHGSLCESLGLKEGNKIISKDFQSLCAGKNLDDAQIIKTPILIRKQSELNTGLVLILSCPTLKVSAMRGLYSMIAELMISGIKHMKFL